MTEMEQSPHVGLVLVTKDRLNYISSFLASLQNQTYRNFSVIFAHEESCGQQAQEIIQPFAKDFALRRIAIPPCGVSAARNAAMGHAQGEILAFPDDDCEYLPDTLEKVVNTFNAERDADAILGFHVHDGMANVKREKESVGRYSVFKGSQTFLQFYRRDCVQAVGKFDDKLGWGTGLPYGSGEDTDYVLRALACGRKVLRVPSVRVKHPWLDLNDPNILFKTGRYAAGRMQLLAKHDYPLWFKLLNILAPLALLPMDAVKHGSKAAVWRWTMFKNRLAAFNV